MMPRIIFKCNYIKGKVSHVKNLVSYISTRDGVQMIDKYKENVVNYISTRPKVEKISTHGLFSFYEVDNLQKVVEQVSNHTGNIWMPIISLTREQAESTGFDNALKWKSLLSQYAVDMAENFKIPVDNFMWYGAFHNHPTHPHVHMIVYSTNPTRGFLTLKSIEKIKSQLTNQIFKNQLDLVYENKSNLRNELKEEIKKVTQDIRDGTLKNDLINKKLLLLSEFLKSTKGKHQFGYLKLEGKQIVNDIVDELQKDSRVEKLYNLWYELKNDIYSSYSDYLPPKIKLSEDKEFNSIKNFIIKLAKENIDYFEENQKVIKDDMPPLSPIVLPKMIDLNQTTRLINNLGKIFDSNVNGQFEQVIKVDSKLFRKLKQRKISQGHSIDDSEVQVKY